MNMILENAELKAPSFQASALKGYNVLETTKTVAKLTIKSVIQKTLLPKQPARTTGA